MTVWEDWSEVLAELEAMHTFPLSEATADDFVWRLNLLESRVYDEQSRREQAFYSDPTNADAFGRLNAFNQEVMPVFSGVVQTQAGRVAPHLLSVRPEWRHAMRPLVEEPRHPGQVVEGLARVRARGEAFHAISASVSDAYPDGGDLSADRASPDRAARERAYRATKGCEAEAYTRKAALFVELHAERQRLARLAGLASYNGLAWQSAPMTERAYTQADVARLRDQVGRHAVPLLTELRNLQAQKLGVESIRPWDVDLYGKGVRVRTQPSTPQAAADALADLFGDISPPLGDVVRHLAADGQFKIAADPAPYLSSYSNFLPTTHESWMYSYYSSVPVTVFSAVHEVGHCLHWSHMPKGALFRQYYPPYDFREFVAHACEVLVQPHLHHFFDEADVPAVRLGFLIQVLTTMVGICALDEFQERIYHEASVTVAQVEAVYLEMRSKYSYGVDVQGLEALVRDEWAIWHVFVQPFYNMEYVVAWLAALNWLGLPAEQARHHLEHTLEQLWDAPAPALFARLGLEMLPGEEELRETMARLGAAARRELA